MTNEWIPSFIQNHGILSRYQLDTLPLSPKKQEWVDHGVANNLGCVSRDVSSGFITESFVQNTDKTHFATDQNDGCPPVLMKVLLFEMYVVGGEMKE